MRLEVHFEQHVLLQEDLLPPRARPLLRRGPRRRARLIDGLRLVRRVPRSIVNLQHAVAAHKALDAGGGAVGLDDWSPPVLGRDVGLARDDAAVEIDAARMDGVFAGPGRGDLDDDGEVFG